MIIDSNGQGPSGMKVQVIGVAIETTAPFHGALTRKLHGQTLVERLIEKGGRFVDARDDILIYTDIEEVALKAERQGVTSRFNPSRDETEDQHLQELREFVRDNSDESDTLLWLSPYAPLVSLNSLKRAQVRFSSTNVDIVFGVTEDFRYTPADTPLTDSELLLCMPASNLESRSSSFVWIRANAFLDKSPKNYERATVPVGRDVFEIISVHDWWVCEKLLTRKRIVFRVIGNEQVGMGHIYRALSLAHEIIDHEIIFITERGNEDVASYFANLDYQLQVVEPDEIIQSILDLEPDLLINDILNTSIADVRGLQRNGIKVVNFEDLGEGAALADLTINELYDYPQIDGDNIRWGREYFFVRDEFEDARACCFREEPEKVLLAFGGIDQFNLTRKLFLAIEPICLELGLKISIVTGPGYREYSVLEQEIQSKSHVSLTHATGVISKIMEGVSIAITSNGRTVYEMAHMNIPAIVVPQHERERTHEFAAEENGFVPLAPYQEGVTEKEVAEEFERIVRDGKYRKKLFSATEPHKFTDNKKQVVDLILASLSNETSSGRTTQLRNLD